MRSKLIHCFAVTLLFFLAIFLYTNSVQAKMPNDPLVKQWAFEHVGAYRAWDYTTGSSEVVVAVIDNGIDMLHPDLEDNMWINTDEIKNNGIDDDKNGYIDDYWGWNFLQEDKNKDGILDENEQKGNNDPRPDVDNLTQKEREENIPSHGTAVAGIIGAVGNNGLDGSGLNWKVKIMNLKIIGNSGEGGSFPLARAIHYAVDNGAQIINVSAVGSSVGDGLAELHEAVDYAYNHGVLIVAAAGNGMQLLNEDKLYPICIDEGLRYQQVLGVTAIDIEHRLARFSNVGSSCVDLTAPGVNVSSTARFSPTNGLMSRYVGGWNGTSFAAPQVAGTAALIKSIQPTWDPEKISEAILKTVHHTLGQDEVVYANLFGAGLLQTDKAVEFAYSKLKSSRPILSIDVWQSTKKGRKELISITKYNVAGDIVEKTTTTTKKIFNKSVQSVKGDFNKDGRDEVAVWGDDPDKRVISIYDSFGKKMFIMYFADSVKKGEIVELLSGDTNGDGKDELIVVAPGGQLTIWSVVPLQRVAEWNVGNGKNSKVRLIGY